jgi:hypothetical protein
MPNGTCRKGFYPDAPKVWSRKSILSAAPAEYGGFTVAVFIAALAAAERLKQR